MIETQPKFGLLFHILSTLLAPLTRRVKAPEETAQRLKDLTDQGQVIFVGRAVSFVDFLVVRAFLKRHSIPGPRFTHGMSPFYWMPLVDAFKLVAGRIFHAADRVGRDEIQQLLENVEQGQHGMVFLKARRGAFTDRDFHYDGFFGKLAQASDQRRAPSFLVPTSIFLTRKRKNTSRTMWDIFFGSYDIPSRTRKALQLLFFSSKGLSLFSTAIDVRAEMERAREKEIDEDALEKRLRWTLLLHLNNEDRAYRGPTKRSRERKVRKILKEKRLREDLKRISEAQERSYDAVFKEADKTLHEIASDTSERMVNFLRLIFDYVWARTIEGIDFKPSDFNKMRELAKNGPIVFLPCHRSHADYLVFAYMFEKQGLSYPRFAAGDNLSKWPLGFFFRRAGAFFIRRTFKGEAIFPVVFEAYIRQQLRDRHVLTFFMEGGRSRTGKLLHPKVGMLGMILDAWQKQVVDDVPLVPVTIDYGRIFEGKAYIEEKTGHEKQKENLRALLRTPKFLRKKHGIIRIRFGDPISMSKFVQQRDMTRSDISFRTKLPLLHDLSYDVMNTINTMVTITAANVLAGILMGNPRRGMTMDQVRTLFVITTRYLGRRGVELSFPEKNFDLALHNAIQTFTDWETLVRVDVGGQRVINIPPNKRPEMEYYKNNGLHFMLDLALTASAVSCLRGDATTSAVIARSTEIYDILQLEFIATADYPDPQKIRAAIKEFVDMGALISDGERLRRGTSDIGRLAFDVCSHLLLNFMESYFIAAEYLLSMTKQDGVNHKDTLKDMITRGELLYAVGTLQNRESINRVTFEQAIARFNKLGYLQLRTAKGQRVPTIHLNAKKTSAFRDMREQLMSWMHAVD